MSDKQGKQVEIKVPAVGESISEVFIGEWYVDEGGHVQADGNVVGLETDKATFDVPAPVSGVVSKVVKSAGETAEIGEVIGFLTESDTAPQAQPEPESEPKPTPPSDEPAEPTDSKGKDAATKRPLAASGTAASGTAASGTATEESQNSGAVMPAAERLMSENRLAPGSVRGTGPGGRVLKEDVVRHMQGGSTGAPGSRETRSVPMSPIRQTIAQRLVSAQQTAALLTTFNEIDMTSVKALRAKYRETFEKTYGIKLGFMSFFVKAAVNALQQYPQINAQMSDKQLIHHNYFDVGIAIGGGKGLVVPVLRNAEHMSFGDIEQAIMDFGRRAKANQIGLEELEGGTFTITNGGVYGSLLSTPIVNPPQSGVLGMHGIFDRPVAVDGQVVIRPMMYVALTYDHRVVDGREAVSFLRRVKELIEDPTRLVLEV